MPRTRISANTLKHARAVVDSTLETPCSIYSRGTEDDGYNDVTDWGLRDVSTCNVHVLGEEFITDEMRERNAKHFALQLPAECELVAGERVTTTWTPVAGGGTEALTIEVVSVNTPRQDKQIGVEAIGYQVA